MKPNTRLAAGFLFFLFMQPLALQAQSSLAGEPLRITRATASIEIDGKLSDEGWQGVKPVTTWYEVNPGDNTIPTVRSVGRIAWLLAAMPPMGLCKVVELPVGTKPVSLVWMFKVPAWLLISSPEETLRLPSTFSAFFAAQAR